MTPIGNFGGMFVNVLPILPNFEVQERTSHSLAYPDPLPPLESGRVNNLGTAETAA